MKPRFKRFVRSEMKFHDETVEPLRIFWDVNDGWSFESWSGEFYLIVL